MGLMDRIEGKLERAVNGAFARTFRSSVQPVEIAAALRRELDIHSVIIDRDRVLTAHRFLVRVSSEDYARLQQYGANLITELQDVISRHADEQGYQLLEKPVLFLETDTSLARGVLNIEALTDDTQVVWEPVIQIGHQQYQVPVGRVVIGRGSDADIQIRDDGASRHHLEILWDGGRGIARDLNSTNGSKVNGQKFRNLKLEPDTVIRVGQTDLVFKLVPRSNTAGDSSASPFRASNTAVPHRHPGEAHR